MTAHFRRLGSAAICAAVLLLVPSPGQAAILVPGGGVIPNALHETVHLGDVEASLDELAFSTPFFSGTLSVAVVRNSGGTLDFYYQITNDATSAHSLSRAILSSFTAPIMTEVFYRVSQAGLATLFVPGHPSTTPLTVDRSLSGALVGFNFTGGPIEPGETSRIIVIRTDAVDFTNTGFAEVRSGVPASLRNLFAPGAAVAAIPEPASLLLLSSAFGAAGYVARRRARRKNLADA